jgi:hypothetical protein
MRQICLYCLKKSIPFQGIFLRVEDYSDSHLSSIFKVILTSLTEHSSFARGFGDYIAVTILLLDLVVELHEVKTGVYLSMGEDKAEGQGRWEHLQARKL